MSVRRSVWLCIAAAVLGLSGPAHAAPFDITEFSVAPDNPQAGAHSDVQIVTGLTGGTGTPHARDLIIHLPPGLVGNPGATTLCSTAQFNGDACPSSSRVGSVQVTAVASAVPIGLLDLRIQGPGEVYNLEPAGGVPARLGLVVRPRVVGQLVDSPPIKVPIDVTLRSRDGGLDSAAAQLPTSAMVRLLGFTLPVSAEAWIERMTLTLEGRPAGASQPFMTNPTACIPANSSLEAVSYNGERRRAESSFTPTNCAAVPFNPSVQADLETTRRGSPSGYTITLLVPPENSAVKRAEVVLPEGTTISPPAAQGLEACSVEQFGPPEAAQACPAASQIGTVSLTSVLPMPLNGQVFLGTPRPDGSLPLFVNVDDQGFRIKLSGLTTLDRATGRVTTVFDDLIPVPFTRFSLSFRGGSRAILANPSTCGAHTVSTRLTPWSGAPNFPPELDRHPTATFTIDADGAGGACGERPFRPGLGISAVSTLAARPTGALTVAVSRPDGDREIDQMTLDMPPGLVANLNGVQLCQEPQASAGSCPAGSRVGRVSVRVGAGPDPVEVTGTVYITGPTGGAPLGLTIVLPAKVGPIDLGTAIVRSGISLRPDGGLRIVTTGLPHFLQGVPVDFRELTLVLDRQNFGLNPSSCLVQFLRGSFTAVGGAQATAEAPYQATGCSDLAYAPRISATLGSRGQTDNAGKPPLKTTVITPAGHAASRNVSVTLPREVAIDLRKVNQLTCRIPQLEAGSCPAPTQVGSVTVQTALLPVPLSGPVILAERGPGKLPGLVMDLHGPLDLRIQGDTELTPQGIKTTFRNLPDIAFQKLDLSLKGGSNGALLLGRDLCAIQPPPILGEFEGYNGKRVTHREAVDVNGCAPRPQVALALKRLGGKRPQLVLVVRRRGNAPKLSRVTLSLPSSLKFRTSVRGGLTAKGDGRKLSRTGARVNKKGTLSLRLPSGGAETVRATLGKGALRITKALKRKLRKRPRLSFNVTVTDREGLKTRTTVRVRARRK